MRPNTLPLLLLAGSILTGTVSAAPLAANASKFLGNITTNGQVRSDFGTYWNQITAENECKWGSVEGREGTYNFTGCKNAYNWAKNNGGHFKFHALVWGGQYPSWLEAKDQAATLSAITKWFDAVKKEFPDLEMIDVVNEAIRTGTNQYHSGYPKTKIIQALGGDNNGDYKFVTTAFKMARERWPKAILIYNDYNTIRWNITEGINLINKIKAAGAPVDAYGQQAHDVTDMNVTDFKNALNRIYNETKIPLIISEYDIGTEDDNLQKQRYSEQIPFMMDAPYIAGITLWGYIYGSTWLTNGNSGIIKNGVDRPAMTWLKQYMATAKGVNTTGLLGGTTTPPVVIPQAPYKGNIAIPGTLEAENYDVGGQDQAYNDADATNQGGVYRQDQVDIVAIPNGNVVGYTATGEWLEYTVNVASAGIYAFNARVSAGADGASFRLFVGNTAITDTVKIANGGSWDTYANVTGRTVSLNAGTQVVRIAITGGNGNIDAITFSKDIPSRVTRLDASLLQGLQAIEVFSIDGTYQRTFEANGLSDLQTQMKSSPLKGGIYLVRTQNAGSGLVTLAK
jgi:endo-1,4-beta-xylanase